MSNYPLMLSSTFSAWLLHMLTRSRLSKYCDTDA